MVSPAIVPIALPLPQASEAIPAPPRGAAALLVAVLIVVAAVSTPFARVQLFPVPGYMLAFGTAMVVTNLILAALLLSRGAAERDATTVLLGSVYLFVAIIFVPMTAAFPGALGATALIGTTYSPIWLWSLWHAGFGLGIVAHAVGAGRPAVPGPSSARAFSAVALLVTPLALVSTVGVEHLPTVFGDPATGMFSGKGEVVGWLLLAIDAVALLATLRLPAKTPERLWLSVAMVAACFDIWLTVHAGARFSLGWYLGKVGSLITTMVVLVSLVNELSALYRRVRVANGALADAANRDGLTGIANRRHLDAVLPTETRRAARLGQSTALLMIDVDHFKSYNDLHGHQQGDDCLRRVASVIAHNARRPGDVAARYGGEEFALVLPTTNAAGAVCVAERILRELAALALPHPRTSTGWVTVSIGIATSESADSERLVGQADVALYRAKHAGRNRIECEVAAQPHEHVQVATAGA